MKGLNPHCGPTIRHLRDKKEDSDGLILVYKNSAPEDTGASGVTWEDFLEREGLQMSFEKCVEICLCNEY